MNLLVRRFLAYLPQDPSPEADPQARRVVGWGKARGLFVAESSFAVAFEAYGRGGPGSPGARQGRTDGGEGESSSLGKSTHLLHVLPGAGGPALQAELEAIPPDPDRIVIWAEGRAHLFNLLRVTPLGLLLLGDMLGLLPVWLGRLDRGVVISSSIRDLFSVFPDLVRPVDPLGVTQYLVGGKGTRTVHARVRVVAPGTVLRWSPEKGLILRRERRVEPVPQEPDIRAVDAMDRVVGLLSEKVSQFVQGASSVVLPLTGGFDSRLIACILSELEVRAEAVTLGRPFHSEVKVARRIARVLGMNHILLAPRGSLLDRVPLWLEMQEGQSGFGTFYISELLDRGYPAGTPILHGLIGGNLVWGAYFTDAGLDGDLEGIASFLTDRTLKSVTPDLGSILGLPVGRESFLEDLRDHLVPAPSPMQTTLIWDLEHRQPRSVGRQLAFLGKEYRVGAPFYDRRQISAWMALPRMVLEKREFVRQVFRTRFPAVGAIPHAEEHPEYLPNSRASLTHLAGYLAQRARDGVLRRILPGHDGRASRRYIWGLWHRLSPEETARQEWALEQKRGAVDAVLGWTPEDAGGRDFWSKVTEDSRKAQSIRTAWFLLTEYCDWLRKAREEGL